MWEYEFKAAVKGKSEIRTQLENLSGASPQIVRKNDLYFGKNGIPLFRLRRLECEGEVSFIVTSKIRKTEGQSEISRESEFSIDRPEEFEEFCRRLGYECLIKKAKTTELFRFDRWNLEWNDVEGLGLFLEAEFLSETELADGVWQNKRLKMMQLLGLQEADLESRPYTQLLSEKTNPKPAFQIADFIEIYSDGGCRPNPGAGAWAFVLLDGEEFCDCGGERQTTNNRMELTAAIEALEACAHRNGCGKPVRFHIDSQYVKNGITVWISGWKAKGWKSSTNLPVKNIDLWKRLDECVQKMKVEWIWVKGHAGNRYNEMCDALCSEMIEKIRN